MTNSSSQIVLERAKLILSLTDLSEFAKEFRSSSIEADDAFLTSVKSVINANKKENIDYRAVLSVMLDDEGVIGYELLKFECENTPSFQDRLVLLAKLMKLALNREQKEWVLSSFIICYSSIGDLQSLEKAYKDLKALTPEE